ncbi:MAG: 50S ribosomal protein L29 [Vampirovibrionales bacterium]|nr:50S ribosomal protein L29 [Vampirovibrionales bacterium]
MKITEIRELTVEELQQKIQECRKELFESRLKHTLQQLENTTSLRKLKRQVAQLNTVLREKQSA